MTSPALEIPIRTPREAAGDLAIAALRRVERGSHEAETVKFVREQLARIDELLKPKAPCSHWVDRRFDDSGPHYLANSKTN